MIVIASEMIGYVTERKTALEGKLKDHLIPAEKL